MVKKSVPRLVVFFDTNALFTQVASDLVRSEIRKLIKENSSHVDLEVMWFLPDVVIDERRFQMMNRAKDLLPNLLKIEKLLGHAFGIGDDTLKLHVDKAIDDQIKELGFHVAQLDTSRVDWNDVISRSALRLPPFDRGEKEKGFRDAIVANTFTQVHKSSPSTPSSCRLAIVTNDERLIEYIKELVADAKNVRILKDIDELESLINTLVSSIPEDFAAELADMASKLFFVKNDEKSLFYKEGIRDRIKRDFSDILKDTIHEGRLRAHGTWWITKPIFVSKIKQRIKWISVVEPEFEIYHYGVLNNDPGCSISQEELDKTSSTSKLGIGALAGQERGVVRPYGLGMGLMTSIMDREKIVDITGREKFEVHWSATLTKAKNLIKPTIEEIKHLGTDFGNGSK